MGSNPTLTAMFAGTLPAFCFCEWCEEGMPDDSAAITVPIDLALADYESRMANALDVLCSYEDVLLSNVIVRIVAWKPAMY